jgi:hypothetical protein
MSNRHDTLRESVKEQLADPRAPEVFAELPQSPSDDAAREEQSSGEITPGPPGPTGETERKISWLRLAYSFLFLLALLVVLTLWSEVGGQGHLDMMPWYTKLTCLVASAWCCVRFTAALVEERNPWNRRALVWFSGLLLVASAMAAITFYYHLHEENQPDSDETTATAMISKPLLPPGTE